MNPKKALTLLDLSEDAKIADINAAYQAKRHLTQQQRDAAPTADLKAKFDAALLQIEQTKDVLFIARPNSSVLSQINRPNRPQTYTSTRHNENQKTDTQCHVQPGQTLGNGRYEMKNLIGQGGMGSVHHAFDNTRKEDIAIKVLLPTMVSSQQARYRFLSEAKLTSQLSHPNIVNVFDVQQDGEHIFIVMELLKGQDLRSLMNSRKLSRQSFSETEAKRFANALSDALDYAHQHTIHRDIKPENIWISETGKIKLMDFGVAQVMTNTQYTQIGIAMGTAYYMAPEQLKGSHHIDGSADQYSLAVMLYELLAGEVPAGRFKPLRAHRKDLSKGFSQAIDQALEADPYDRFADMATFKAALNKNGNATILTPSAKALGIASILLLLIGAGYVVTQPGNLSEWFSGSEDVAQQRYMQAIQLEGEIKDLAERLSNNEKNLKDHLREAKKEIRRLNARSDTQQAKTELAQQQRRYNLSRRVVYQSNDITTLKGKKILGETMVRDKKYQQAIPVLKQVKQSYQTLLTKLEAIEPLYRAQDTAIAQQIQWQTYAQQHGFTLILQQNQLAEQLNQANDEGDQGQFQQAKENYKTVTQRYQQLQQAAIQQAKTRNYVIIQQNKWRKYIHENKISSNESHVQQVLSQADAQRDRGEFKAAQISYQQAGQAYVLLLEQTIEAKRKAEAATEAKRKAAATAEAERKAAATAEAERKAAATAEAERKAAAAEAERKAAAAEAERKVAATAEAKRKAAATAEAKRKAAATAEAKRKAEATAEAKRKAAATAEAKRKAAATAEAERKAAATAEAERKAAAAEAKRKTAAAAEAKRKTAAAAEAKRKVGPEAKRSNFLANFAPEMVAIPAGKFRMGGRFVRPVHQVKIGAFELGKYEVTQVQWKRVMGDNPANFGGDNKPVENVSWNDIQLFLKKLNQLTGQQYRLPSEAEWEYAARAKSTTKYSWGNDIGLNRANCKNDTCGDSFSKTAPVGSFQANPFGLHDMHGNVEEFVEDCWHFNFTGAPSNGSAWVANCKKSDRVYRGGSWDDGPRNLRSTERSRNNIKNRYNHLGFRLARTL